ncbi:CPBP family intramembrane glutamic endopeptidase [Anaerovorax odorimutans]|uniref:CPBP family intramembrane glutamic endopeptidase n=1 Tax=Anaerovorax odorimutans TaxID=109327 RepID=UPI00042012E9|nr:CPBP family intramembrane glutamic endopeptidase [Anaerovorax odorimutans]
MLENNVKINEKQWNKKECRKNTNKLAGGILIYELIMLLIVTIDMIRRSIPFFIDDQLGLDSVLDEAMNSGTSSIVAVFLGLLFLVAYFRKCNYRRLIFHMQDKMTGRSFLILLTFFMSVQVVFNLTGMGMEACLNQFGLSILGEIESASSNSTTISMLLYASFIGPISEEIIFRGFVMRGFQKYGDYYAIFMSAVIFGAFHGNLIQSMFAAMVGLVLGYVAMKYSIKWSIILHVINNFVFGDLLPYLTSNLNESMQSILFYVIEGIFCAGAIAIILLKRNEVREFIKRIKVKKGLLGVTFTSVWILIFLIVQILMGISGIEKLTV